MQVYGASKLYNIMAAKALNEKLKGTGVEAFSAHPGEAFAAQYVLTSQVGLALITSVPQPMSGFH